MPHIQLQYSIDGTVPQPGAGIDNSLFGLLSALHSEGSIRGAAAASGASYRHVWGALKRWEQTLGDALVTWTQGHPARLTPLAERLLAGERRARARCAPQIRGLRAELERVFIEAHSSPLLTLDLVASAEPVTGLLYDGARAHHGLHLALQADTSLGALRALADGRCSVAAVHRPASPTRFDVSIAALLRGGRHQVLCHLRRRQGLMVAPGNPHVLQVLAGLARPGVRCVLRPAGSGTQALLEQQLRQQGLKLADLQTVAVETSHEAAAVAVACGAGDAALGTEAAARAAGLDFVPLLDDDWLLLAPSAALNGAAMTALRQTLQDPAWRAAVTALPGHTLVDPLSDTLADTLSETPSDTPSDTPAEPAPPPRQTPPTTRSASVRLRGAPASK